MKINIYGRGIKVSSYLEDLVDKKLGKLERYFREDTIAQVTLEAQKNRQICEITIPIKGATLRAKETSGDLYASIDGGVDKIEKQIRKHRTKLEKRLHETAFKGMPILEEDDFEAERTKIVRSKRFDLKPMDVEEAMLQMELLGHSFFVFLNAESGMVSVLYLRDDGDLGLIEPNY